MTRALKRFLIITILLLGSVCWIYLICVRCSFQENIIGAMPDDNYNENDYEADQLLIRHIQAEMLEKNNELESPEGDLIGISDNDPNLIPEKLEMDILAPEDDDQKWVEQLKQKLKGNSVSKDIEFEEDFLRVYIKNNDCNVEKAYSKIVNFVNLRKNHNDLFHNINFDFTQNPAYRFITILPERLKDGSVTVIFEIAKWNPDKVPLVHLKRLLFMTYMQELRNPVTQVSGFNVIYDFADIGFRYVKFASPENLYLLNHVSHEVMPITFVGIHLVNINFLANMLVTLIRPFIPPFIEKVFYVHSSVKNLHDFFPKSMLPVKYGGHLAHYYNADWIRKANEQHDNYPATGQKNIF